MTVYSRAIRHFEERGTILPGHQAEIAAYLETKARPERRDG